MIEKMLAKITVKKGDITDEKTDAIVNAANTDLKLGTGVAGAIKTKGGPAIQQECDKIIKEKGSKLEPGNVAVTSGGDLKAKIIHAAVINLGENAKVENVKNAVANAVKQAVANGMKTVSIPALGAGVGGLTPEVSAIAIFEGLLLAKDDLDKLTEINLVAYDDNAKKAFEAGIAQLKSRATGTKNS